MSALVTGPPIGIYPPTWARTVQTNINKFQWLVGSNIYQVVVDGTAVRVMLSTDGGNTWNEQDAANHPTNGFFTCSSFFNPNTGIIYILNLFGFPTLEFQIVSFNTGTNLYGATSSNSPAFTGDQDDLQFAALYQQSNGTLIVVTGSNTDPLSYVALPSISGSWGSITALGSISEPIVWGVSVDSSDRGHLVFQDSTGSINYALISSGLTLGTPIVLTSSNFFDDTGTDQQVWNNQIAVAWTGGVGATDNILQVAIGTPLGAATFTTYTVATIATTATIQYATLAQDINGNLVVFAWVVDYTTTPITQQLLMWTFDGVSSWGSPVLFYDEFANPPIDSQPQIDQFGHTGGVVQLPDGSWAFSGALEINDPGEFCAGFEFVSPPLGPSPPTPPPLGAFCPTATSFLVGQPYSSQARAVGGTAPFTWALLSGTLPPGLTLSSSGLLSGTPTTVGSYAFILQATDANGQTIDTPTCPVTIANCPDAL